MTGKCIDNNDGSSPPDDSENPVDLPTGRLIRPLLLLALALLVPVIPFVLLGDDFEESARKLISREWTTVEQFALIAGVLSTDILLPIPSSAVSTYAGGVLGTWWGACASWLGMSAGSILGFTLARACGRPLASRMAGPDELVRMERVVADYGMLAIVITRPLPVLAEACVLFTGATGFSWRRFLPPMLLANAAISLVYAVFGAYAFEHDAMPLAIAAALVGPVIVMLIVRRQMRRR